MNHQEIVNLIRSVAAELRIAPAGVVGPGTRHRVNQLRQPLGEWFTAEHEEIPTPQYPEGLRDSLAADGKELPEWRPNMRATHAGELVRSALLLLSRASQGTRDEVQKAVEDLPDICDQLESLQKQPIAEPPPTDDPEIADKQRGLDHWNSSPDVSWSDVNELLGRPPDHKDATAKEIRDYAKAKNLYRMEKRAGAKRRRESNESNQ